MKSLVQYIKESKEHKFKVWLLVGIPGSGKTTWCDKNLPEGTPTVSRDIIRTQLGYTKNSEEKVVLSPADENEVTKEEYKQINQLAFHKTDFAIDDTNTGRFRKGLIEYLRKLGAKVIGVNINTQLETCIERRKDQIPEDVMRKLYKKKIDLKEDEVDEIINVENGKQKDDKEK